MRRITPVTLSLLTLFVLILMACSPADTPTPFPTYTPYPTPSYSIPVFDKEEVEGRVAADMYRCAFAMKQDIGETYSQQQAQDDHQFQARYIGRDEWIVLAVWPGIGGFGEWKFNERTGITRQYGKTDSRSPLEYCIDWGVYLRGLK